MDDDASPADGPGVDTGPGVDADAAREDAVLADLLIEEVSIDGMCGVY